MSAIFCSRSARVASSSARCSAGRFGTCKAASAWAGRPQRRQCRIGLGEVRLIGGDLLLGLGELRLGVGLALGKRCRALGVLLLAVLDLLLARRKRGSGCIQLALALVQLLLAASNSARASASSVFARASSFSYSARASSKSAWASAFMSSTRACSRAGRDALDGGHNAGHAIVVGIAVGREALPPLPRRRRPPRRACPHRRPPAART